MSLKVSLKKIREGAAASLPTKTRMRCLSGPRSIIWPTPRDFFFTLACVLSHSFPALSLWSFVQRRRLVDLVELRPHPAFGFFFSASQ